MYPIHLLETKPQTTAHLAQTMSLLNMTSAELKQTIEAELANNPALELLEPRRCRGCGRFLVDSKSCPICNQLHDPSNLEPIVFTSSRSDYQSTISGGSTHSLSPDELPDDNTAPALDLASFVLRQIAADLAEEDRPIAAHILTSLDKDGLLTVSLLEISRYHHKSIESIEKVLNLIKHSEPVGVGSSSPQEALLVQLDVLSKTKAVPDHVEIAIREGIDLLSRHHFTKLGQKLGISAQEAEEISRYISTNLNPYPSRSYWGSVRQGSETTPQVYHHPDILIGHLNKKTDGPLVIEILFPVRGPLRLNPLFRKEIKNAQSEKVEKWQRDLEKASLLIKCLRQRNNTMRQLLAILTKYQRNFITHGDRYLKPITRASMAKILGVHESTVSRAVSGKTARLPNGRIIPLGKFFDRSLPIRALIREIVDDEIDALTDSQIAVMLGNEGYNVARRTVAKYRSMEGILSARTRQSMVKI